MEPNSNCRVFITHDIGGKDFTHAGRFGTLIPLVKGRLPYDMTGQEMLNDLNGMMRDYAEGDFLLLSGDPVIISIASMIAFSKVKRVNFLRWSRWDRGYEVIAVKDQDGMSKGMKRYTDRRGIMPV